MQRILVVDDMATNRELLREILEDDYSIETAENGENTGKSWRRFFWIYRCQNWTALR